MESGGEKIKNRSEGKCKAAQHPKGLALYLTERRLYLPDLRFSINEVNMNPFPFEELQKILELKDTELITDELLFNSVMTNLERELGFGFEDKNYNEIQTVRDCKVYTNYDNITEMVNIIDMNTKERIPNCVIDGRTIFFLFTQYEGHVVFLNYNAGFLPETFPADLKEAVIKMFLIKKKEFIKNINHEETEITELPLDVQKIIHSYKRKSL